MVIYATKKIDILIIFQMMILLLLLLNTNTVQPVNAQSINTTENISVKERTVCKWNSSGSCQLKITINDVCTLESGCGYQTVKVKIETDESGKWQEIPISCRDCEGLYFIYNHTEEDLQFHNNKDPTSPPINALIIPSPFTQVISCLANVLKKNIKASILPTDYGDIHFYRLCCYSPSEGKLIIKCCSEIGKVCFVYEWSDDGVLDFGGLYSYRYNEYIFYNELIDKYQIIDGGDDGDDGDGKRDRDDDFDLISLFPLIILLMAFVVIATITLITTLKKKNSELKFLEKRLKFLKNLEGMIRNNACGFDIAYEIMEEKVLDEKDPPKLLQEIFDLAKRNGRNTISTSSPLANKIRENISHIKNEIDWINYQSEREKHRGNDIV